MNTKNALIVGATDGIGKQTALNLLREGYFVLAVGRNPQKLSTLQTQLGTRGTTYQADLSLLEETRRVGREIATEHQSIDLVVHCADVLASKRIETVEGHEASFATNYLSRFSLNSLLIQSLQKSAKPRIIHVAAAGMPLALSKENFPVPREASSFIGHNIGQAANDYYGLIHAEKFPSVAINILNPGMVATKIRKEGKGGKILKTLMHVMDALFAPVATSVEDYAKIVVNIALGNNAEAGQSVLLNRKGRAMQPRKDRFDTSMRDFIWRTSEEMTAPKQHLIVQDSTKD